MIDPELRDSGPGATDSLMRQFAGLCLLLFGTLAAVEAVLRHRPWTAIVCVLLAIVVGVGGLARPAFVRPIFSAAMTVAMPIGWVVSHVLLAVAFYGVFTPMAFVFRLIGRDALARRRRTDRDTYWTVKEQPPDADSYLRES